MKRLFISICFAAVASSCTAIKPYQKQYLLDPLMDDAEIAKLSPAAGKSFASRYEKLANGAATGSGGSSCPTCGG